MALQSLNSNGTRPGEQVLYTLFKQFTQLGKSRIEMALADPNEHVLVKAMHIYDDPSFGQLLNAFRSVSEFALPSLLAALVRWYQCHHSAGSVSLNWSDAERANDGEQVNASNQPFHRPASSNSPNQCLSSNPVENRILAERRDLAVDIIFCHFCQAVLSQLNYHPGHNNLIDAILSHCFRRFSYRDDLEPKNSENITFVADLYAELVGMLSQSRFTLVRCKFTRQLNELRAKENQPNVKPSIISLIMGMKFFRVKMHPIEDFANCCNFLQELGRYFLEVRENEIKHVLADLFVEVLLPVASVARHEVNIPSLRAFVEALYQPSLDWAGKKKHVLALFPLVTCLLCVSTKAFFLQNWTNFVTLCLSQLKNRQSKIALVSLQSLSCLLWVYIVRIRGERHSETQAKLSLLVNSVFPKNQKFVVPKDAPINIFVRMVQFIAHEKLDFTIKEIIIDRLGVSGSQKTILMPERMNIGLCAFLLIAHNLQQTTTSLTSAMPISPPPPPMPQQSPTVNHSSLSLEWNCPAKRSSNAYQQRAMMKRSFGGTNLNESLGRLLGLQGHLGLIRRAFEHILRQLDLQVGRPMMLPAKHEALTQKEMEELMTTERKPKLDLLKTCVACIPRLLPLDMTRFELVELLARVGLNVDEDVRKMAQQSMANLIVEIPPFRVDIIREKMSSPMCNNVLIAEPSFIQFIQKTIADTSPHQLDSCLRTLFHLLNNWKLALQKDGAVSATFVEHSVLAEAEGFALVMLCHCRSLVRRLAVHLLRKCRDLINLVNSISCPGGGGDRQPCCCIDVLDAASPELVRLVLPLVPLSDRLSLSSTSSLDFSTLTEKSSPHWLGFASSQLISQHQTSQQQQSESTSSTATSSSQLTSQRPLNATAPHNLISVPASIVVGSATANNATTGNSFKPPSSVLPGSSSSPSMMGQHPLLGHPAPTSASYSSAKFVHNQQHQQSYQHQPSSPTLLAQPTQDRPIVADLWSTCLAKAFSHLSVECPASIQHAWTFLYHRLTLLFPLLDPSAQVAENRASSLLRTSSKKPLTFDRDKLVALWHNYVVLGCVIAPSSSGERIGKPTMDNRQYYNRRPEDDAQSVVGSSNRTTSTMAGESSPPCRSSREHSSPPSMLHTSSDSPNNNSSSVPANLAPPPSDILTESASTPTVAVNSSSPSQTVCKSNARDLVKLLIPLLRCEQPDMRDSAVAGLGRINPSAFTDVLDELHPLLKESVDRKQENVRRKRRRDYLRASLIRLLALMSRSGVFSYTESNAFTAKGTLTSHLIDYLDGMRIYLESVADQALGFPPYVLTIAFCQQPGGGAGGLKGTTASGLPPPCDAGGTNSTHYASLGHVSTSSVRPLLTNLGASTGYPPCNSNNNASAGLGSTPSMTASAIIGGGTTNTALSAGTTNLSPGSTGINSAVSAAAGLTTSTSSVSEADLLVVEIRFHTAVFVYELIRQLPKEKRVNLLPVSLREQLFLLFSQWSGFHDHVVGSNDSLLNSTHPSQPFWSRPLPESPPIAHPTLLSSDTAHTDCLVNLSSSPLSLDPVSLSTNWSLLPVVAQTATSASLISSFNANWHFQLWLDLLWTANQALAVLICCGPISNSLLLLSSSLDSTPLPTSSESSSLLTTSSSFVSAGATLADSSGATMPSVRSSSANLSPGPILRWLSGLLVSRDACLDASPWLWQSPVIDQGLVSTTLAGQGGQSLRGQHLANARLLVLMGGRRLDSLLRQLGEEALTLLLDLNPTNSFLVNWAVDRCLTARNPSLANSCYSIVCRLLANSSDFDVNYIPLLITTFIYLDHPNKTLSNRAYYLLRLLYQRFVLKPALALHNDTHSSSPTTKSHQQPVDFSASMQLLASCSREAAASAMPSMATSTTASVDNNEHCGCQANESAPSPSHSVCLHARLTARFWQAFDQLSPDEVIRQFAAQHPDYTIGIISEISRRIEKASPDSGIALLQLLQPWIINLELVDLIPKTDEDLENDDDELIAANGGGDDKAKYSDYSGDSIPRRRRWCDLNGLDEVSSNGDGENQDEDSESTDDSGGELDYLPKSRFTYAAVNGSYHHRIHDPNSFDQSGGQSVANSQGHDFDTLRSRQTTAVRYVVGQRDARQLPLRGDPAMVGNEDELWARVPPTLTTDGWGSRQTTEYVLNNLFYLTVCLANNLVASNCMQRIWALLIRHRPANLRPILRYLIIVCSLAPATLLSHIRRLITYLAIERPDSTIEYLMTEMQTFDKLGLTIERTVELPFFCILTTTHPGPDMAPASSQTPVKSRSLPPDSPSSQKQKQADEAQLSVRDRARAYELNLLKQQAVGQMDVDAEDDAELVALNLGAVAKPLDAVANQQQGEDTGGGGLLRRRRRHLTGGLAALAKRFSLGDAPSSSSKIRPKSAASQPSKPTVPVDVIKIDTTAVENNEKPISSPPPPPPITTTEPTPVQLSTQPEGGSNSSDDTKSISTKSSSSSSSEDLTLDPEQANIDPESRQYKLLVVNARTATLPSTQQSHQRYRQRQSQLASSSANRRRLRAPPRRPPATDPSVPIQSSSLPANLVVVNSNDLAPIPLALPYSIPSMPSLTWSSKSDHLSPLTVTPAAAGDDDNYKSSPVVAANSSSSTTTSGRDQKLIRSGPRILDLPQGAYKAPLGSSWLCEPLVVGGGGSTVFTGPWSPSGPRSPLILLLTTDLTQCRGLTIDWDRYLPHLLLSTLLGMDHCRALIQEECKLLLVSLLDLACARNDNLALLRLNLEACQRQQSIPTPQSTPPRQADYWLSLDGGPYCESYTTQLGPLIPVQPLLAPPPAQSSVNNPDGTDLGSQSMALPQNSDRHPFQSNPVGQRFTATTSCGPPPPIQQLPSAGDIGQLAWHGSTLSLVSTRTLIPASSVTNQDESSGRRQLAALLVQQQRHSLLPLADAASEPMTASGDETLMHQNDAVPRRSNGSQKSSTSTASTSPNASRSDVINWCIRRLGRILLCVRSGQPLWTWDDRGDFSSSIDHSINVDSIDSLPIPLPDNSSPLFQVIQLVLQLLALTETESVDSANRRLECLHQYRRRRQRHEEGLEGRDTSRLLRFCRAALSTGLACPNRHYANRSLQIFRLCGSPLDSRWLSRLVGRLGETIADPNEELRGYVDELLATQAAALSHLQACYCYSQTDERSKMGSTHSPSCRRPTDQSTNFAGPSPQLKQADAIRYRRHSRQSSSVSFDSLPPIPAPPSVKNKIKSCDEPPLPINNDDKETTPRPSPSSSQKHSVSDSRINPPPTRRCNLTPDRQTDLVVGILATACCLLESDFEREYSAGVDLLLRILPSSPPTVHSYKCCTPLPVGGHDTSTSSLDYHVRVEQLLNSHHRRLASTSSHSSSAGRNVAVFPGLFQLAIKGCSSSKLVDSACHLLTHLLPHLDSPLVLPPPTSPASRRLVMQRFTSSSSSQPEQHRLLLFSLSLLTLLPLLTSAWDEMDGLRQSPVEATTSTTGSSQQQRRQSQSQSQQPSYLVQGGFLGRGVRRQSTTSHPIHTGGSSSGQQPANNEPSTSPHPPLGSWATLSSCCYDQSTTVATKQLHRTDSLGCSSGWLAATPPTPSKQRTPATSPTLRSHHQHPSFPGNSVRELKPVNPLCIQAAEELVRVAASFESPRLANLTFILRSYASGSFPRDVDQWTKCVSCYLLEAVNGADDLLVDLLRHVTILITTGPACMQLPLVKIAALLTNQIDLTQPSVATLLTHFVQSASIQFLGTLFWPHVERLLHTIASRCSRLTKPPATTNLNGLDPSSGCVIDLTVAAAAVEVPLPETEPYRIELAGPTLSYALPDSHEEDNAERISCSSNFVEMATSSSSRLPVAAKLFADASVEWNCHGGPWQARLRDRIYTLVAAYYGPSHKHRISAPPRSPSVIFSQSTETLDPQLSMHSSSETTSMTDMSNPNELQLDETSSMKEAAVFRDLDTYLDAQLMDINFLGVHDFRTDDEPRRPWGVRGQSITYHVNSSNTRSGSCLGPTQSSSPDVAATIRSPSFLVDYRSSHFATTSSSSPSTNRFANDTLMTSSQTPTGNGSGAVIVDSLPRNQSLPQLPAQQRVSDNQSVVQAPPPNNYVPATITDPIVLDHQSSHNGDSEQFSSCLHVVNPRHSTSAFDRRRTRSPPPPTQRRRHVSCLDSASPTTNTAELSKDAKSSNSSLLMTDVVTNWSLTPPDSCQAASSSPPPQSPTRLIQQRPTGSIESPRSSSLLLNWREISEDEQRWLLDPTGLSTLLLLRPSHSSSHTADQSSSSVKASLATNALMALNRRCLACLNWMVNSTGYSWTDDHPYARMIDTVNQLTNHTRPPFVCFNQSAVELLIKASNDNTSPSALTDRCRLLTDIHSSIQFQLTALITECRGAPSCHTETNDDDQSIHTATLMTSKLIELASQVNRTVGLALSHLLDQSNAIIPGLTIDSTLANRLKAIANAWLMDRDRSASDPDRVTGGNNFDLDAFFQSLTRLSLDGGGGEPSSFRHLVNTFFANRQHESSNSPGTPRSGNSVDRLIELLAFYADQFWSQDANRRDQPQFVHLTLPVMAATNSSSRRPFNQQELSDVLQHQQSIDDIDAFCTQLITSLSSPPPCNSTTL